jgi:predicted metal-dependent hydrolase
LASRLLTAKQAERLAEGIRLFNRGEFFQCHEVLESVWLECAGELKLFLQGLIQVAVAFYHLRHGNFPGAERLMRAGMAKLSSFPPGQHVLDVTSLLASLNPLLERLAAGELVSDWPAPALRLLLSPPASDEGSP